MSLNNKDFKTLVEPLNMLTGYCRSASEMTPKSDLKKWSKQLIKLANDLDNAWGKVI